MVLTEPYFLSVKTASGFCPQSTWCAPNLIFYRSKQPSASIRKAHGAHRTLFFIGQNNLRLLSAKHLVFTEPYFLSVKTAFGFYPQRTRCSRNPIFYRSKQPSASIRNAHGAHGTLFLIGQNSLRLLSAKHPVLTEPFFFIGQNSLRLLSAKHPVLAEPYFLSVKPACGFCPQSTWCSPNLIFYRSEQPSASVHKAPGARRTLFFIVQNSLRLLSPKHTVLTEPYFLSVKTAFGFCPQSTRCSSKAHRIASVLHAPGPLAQTKLPAAGPLREQSDCPPLAP